MADAEWFPVSVKPDVPGWYTARFDDGSGYLEYWFDGAVWRYAPDEGESLFGNGSDGWDGDVWSALRMGHRTSNRTRRQ
jgi:hypothetical protein